MILAPTILASNHRKLMMICASSKSRRESKQCCRSQKIQVIAERVHAAVQRDAQPECIGAEATENQAFEGGTADHNPVEKPG